MTAAELGPIGPYAGQDRWTWLARLHLANDPGLWQTAADAMNDAVAADDPDDEGRARYVAANALRDFVADAMADVAPTHDPVTTMARDLLGQAVAAVDWQYVAAALDERYDPDA